MPFWVPGKDAVIAATKEDIEEYARKYHAGELKMRGKSGYQQSFAYFLKHKLNIPDYQRVSVEVSYANQTTSETQAGLNHPHREEPTNYIDLRDVEMKGLNFSGVSFYSTRFPEDLEDTVLLGAKFHNVDFSGTKIEDALVDRNVFEGTILPDDARNTITKAIQELESFSTENLTSADGFSIGTHADFQWALKLIMSGDAYLEISTTIDPAFNFFRLSYAMGSKDSEKYIEEIERASKKVIDDMAQVVVAEKLGKQSLGRKVGEVVGGFLSGWITKRGPELLQGDKKESERQRVIKDINHVFAECKDYLRYEFLPKEDQDKVKAFLRDNIERFAASPDDQRVGMIRQATQEWVASQTAENKRWEKIQKRAGKGKIKEKAHEFKRHMQKTGQLRGGEFWDCLKGHAVPDALSLSKPSKYPAIDPTDTESISRDIYLKQRGAKFLATIAGVGTGAVVAPAATKLVSSIATSYGVPSLTVGTGAAVAGGGGIGGLLARSFAEGVINQENYHKLNNGLGDSLLELGALAEILEPHLKTLGLSVGGAVLGDQLGLNGGIVKFIKDSYFSVIAATAAYTGYKNYKAIKGEMDEQGKIPFQDRVRPGSKVFDEKIKKKLFDLPKTIVIVTLATAACVIAGPVLFHGLLVAKLLPDLALIGLSIAGAVTGAGAAYFGYGAVKSLYGFVSSKLGRTVRGNEAEKDLSTELEATQERRVKIARKFIGRKRLVARMSAPRGLKFTDEQNQILKESVAPEKYRLVLEMNAEERNTFFALNKNNRDKILELEPTMRSEALQSKKLSEKKAKTVTWAEGVNIERGDGPNTAGRDVK